MASECDELGRAPTGARQLETGAFRADAGTVTTKIWNVGRDEAARLMGGIASVELSALLDGNQCPTCEQLDGETYPFNSEEHLAHVPPLRDCEGGSRCRCLLAYVPDAGGGE